MSRNMDSCSHWKLHPNSYSALTVSSVHHINMDLQLNPYLEAGDGESAGLVRQRGDGNDEGTVGDVLIVELDGHLVVPWEADALFTDSIVLRRWKNRKRKAA